MKTQTLLLGYYRRDELWRWCGNRRVRFCCAPFNALFGTCNEDDELIVTVSKRVREDAVKIRVKVTWFYTGLRYIADVVTFTAGKNAFQVKNPGRAMYNEVGHWLRAHVPLEPNKNGDPSFVNLYVSAEKKWKDKS